MVRSKWSIVLLLVAPVAIAAPALAQETTEVHNSIAVITTEGYGDRPEQLPATYEAPVKIRVQTPQTTPCPCTETWLDLSVDVPDDMEASLEPASFTIEWPDAYPQMVQEDMLFLHANLTVQVPASYTGKAAHKVTIEGEGGTDSPVAAIHVVPTQLQLDFPEDEEAASSAGASGSEQGAQLQDASSGAGEDEAGDQASVPAPGGLLVLVGLPALAVGMAMMRGRRG